MRSYLVSVGPMANMLIFVKNMLNVADYCCDRISVRRWCRKTKQVYPLLHHKSPAAHEFIQSIRFAGELFSVLIIDVIA